MSLLKCDKIETAASAPPTPSKGESALVCRKGLAETGRQDLLRRFTSTPYTANLRLMQRTVRLETNSKTALALTLKFYERHQYGRAGRPEFLWRLVCEPDPRVESTSVRLSAFSDFGLQYINVGQRGFLAVDLERREAKGFLADLFLEGTPRFKHRPPIDALFCMTAASLGLVAVSGGCVGVKDRGVMIFGPPNSGKTTACYLSAKMGMEFHADQVVFLDMRRNSLRAWGDTLPAVFRPETLDFLPELRRSATRSSYGDLSFYYFDKTPLQSRRARPVAPVCSLFLDRGSRSKPHLNEISKSDAVSRLRGSMLLNEDPRFDEQTNAALMALTEKPIYNLQYDNNPRTAANFIEKMLR